MGHRSDVQGLRAIAVLLVVLFHTEGIVLGGFVGVDMFFVISGFVIAGSIASQVGEGSFSTIEFLMRRIRRLIPALGLMLLVVVGLATWLVTYGALTQTVRTGLFASLSLANVYLYRFRPRGYFEIEEKQNALLHTWSLSLEEQFFIALAIVVGLVLFVSRNRTLLRKGLLWTLGVTIGLGSLLGCVWLAWNPIDDVPNWADRFVGPTKLGSEFSFFLPFARAWQFLVGVLIAVVAMRLRPSIGRLIALLGVGLIVIAAWRFGSIENYPGPYAILPTVGTASVIVASQSFAGMHQFLSSRYLTWIGDRSYGIYLWHWPCILFVKPFFPESRLALILAVLASVLPAYLSYRFVETPIRYGGFWSRRFSTVSLAATSVVLVVAAFQLSRDPAPELGAHLDRQIGCEVGAEVHLDPDGQCALEPEVERGHAILLGDSHAGMLSEAFVDASHRNSLTAVLAIETGSPFVVPVWDPSSISTSSTARVVNQVIAQRPEVVVLAQSTWPLPPQAGAATWADAIRPILESFRAARIPVVLASTTYFPYGDPLLCSHLQTLIDRCPADLVFDVDEEPDMGVTKVMIERSFADEFDNVAQFDIASVLCPEGICDTRPDGTWWWRDRTHISIHASKLLGPSLDRAIDAAREETKKG